MAYFGIISTHCCVQPSSTWRSFLVCRSRRFSQACVALQRQDYQFVVWIHTVTSCARAVLATDSFFEGYSSVSKFCFLISFGLTEWGLCRDGGLARAPVHWTEDGASKSRPKKTKQQLVLMTQHETHAVYYLCVNDFTSHAVIDQHMTQTCDLSTRALGGALLRYGAQTSPTGPAANCV